MQNERRKTVLRVGIMREMKLFYIFIMSLYFITLCCEASRSGIIQFSKQLNGQTFNTVSGISLKLCVEKCQRKGKCLSINYHRMLKLCEFITATGNSDIISSQSRGWVYSAIDTWPYVYPTPCEDNACSINTTCIAESVVGYICKMEECITFPSIENGAVLGNMNSIGSTTGIECYSGFALVGQSFAVCVENNGWSSYGECFKTCPNLPMSNDLRIINESLSEVVSVTYECIGYLYIIGNATNYCINGTWSFELPQCISECPTGETYSNSTNSCVGNNRCASGYTNTFTLYKNSVILGEDEAGPISIATSISECLALCIEEMNYECVSVDVYKNSTCYLQSLTGEDVGGLSSTIDFDYYQRDCL